MNKKSRGHSCAEELAIFVVLMVFLITLAITTHAIGGLLEALLSAVGLFG
jgi:hypothetical protein